MCGEKYVQVSSCRSWLFGHSYQSEAQVSLQVVLSVNRLPDEWFTRVIFPLLLCLYSVEVFCFEIIGKGHQYNLFCSDLVLLLSWCLSISPKFLL